MSKSFWRGALVGWCSALLLLIVAKLVFGG